MALRRKNCRLDSALFCQQTPVDGDPSAMMPYAAVISGRSRLGAQNIARSLAEQLSGRVELSITVVDSSEEATEVARAAAEVASTVIAVGGDGTVADVATGIFRTTAVLGIVPAGSTNITARSLGIPADPRAAIALLAGPHRRQPIDVGLSHDRCFLHMAGAGVDAEMFMGADPEWKRRVGWLAYLPPAAAALRLTPSSVEVVADDEIIRARSPLVLVANGSAAISPAFKIHPDIVVDDGWLDILIFTATTPAQVAATLGHVGSQRLDRSPHVIWRRARKIRMTADPPLPVQLDGDPLGWTPREFSVAHGGLQVISPLT